MAKQSVIDRRKGERRERRLPISAEKRLSPTEQFAADHLDLDTYAVSSNWEDKDFFLLMTMSTEFKWSAYDEISTETWDNRTKMFQYLQ